MWNWLTRVRRFVERDYDGITVAGVSTGRDAHETLDAESDDVVTDVSFPDFDLAESFDAVDSIDPDVQVVLHIDASPESAPDAAVGRADTILQRSPRPEAQFLVRKDQVGGGIGRVQGRRRRARRHARAGPAVSEGEVRRVNETSHALFPAAERADGRPDVGAAVASALEDPAPFVDLRTKAIRNGTAADRSTSRFEGVRRTYRSTIGPLARRDGFYVVDDGPEISEERKAEVFDHGFTSSPDGAGFALSIVADVVKSHGWSVEIRDAKSGGARFEIETDGES